MVMHVVISVIMRLTLVLRRDLGSVEGFMKRWDWRVGVGLDA